MRRPPCPRIAGLQHLKAGFHGNRAGVVAFVDDGQRALAKLDALAHTPALDRLHRRQRLRRRYDVAAQRPDRQQYAKAVHDVVQAGQAHAVLQRLALDDGADGAACRMDRAVGQPGAGVFRRAEAQDARQALGPGGGDQPGEMRIVAVEHHGAVRRHAFEDFGLGVGDGLDGAEMFKMDRFDRRYDRDIGLNLTRQRPDLTGMVHAKLEHRIGAIDRHPGEAEGNAPVVVEAARRGEGRGQGAKAGRQRFLGAGLADRTGDGDDLRPGRAGVPPSRDPARPRRCPRPAGRAHRLRHRRAGAIPAPPPHRRQAPWRHRRGRRSSGLSVR